MTFDNEEQKRIVLELLDSVTVPGKLLDQIYHFKQEVLIARVEEEKKES